MNFYKSSFLIVFLCCFFGHGDLFGQYDQLGNIFFPLPNSSSGNGPVLWNSIFNIPPDIADGDDDKWHTGGLYTVQPNGTITIPGNGGEPDIIINGINQAMGDGVLNGFLFDPITRNMTLTTSNGFSETRNIPVGIVDWTTITNIPPDIADGDDDTNNYVIPGTYTASGGSVDLPVIGLGNVTINGLGVPATDNNFYHTAGTYMPISGTITIPGINTGDIILTGLGGSGGVSANGIFDANNQGGTTAISQYKLGLNMLVDGNNKDWIMNNIDVWNVRSNVGTIISSFDKVVLQGGFNSTTDTKFVVDNGEIRVASEDEAMRLRFYRREKEPTLSGSVGIGTSETLGDGTAYDILFPDVPGTVGQVRQVISVNGNDIQEGYVTPSGGGGGANDGNGIFSATNQGGTTAVSLINLGSDLDWRGGGGGADMEFTELDNFIVEGDNNFRLQTEAGITLFGGFNSNDVSVAEITPNNIKLQTETVSISNNGASGQPSLDIHAGNATSEAVNISTLNTLDGYDVILPENANSVAVGEELKVKAVNVNGAGEPVVELEFGSSSNSTVAQLYTPTVTISNNLITATVVDEISYVGDTDGVVHVHGFVIVNNSGIGSQSATYKIQCPPGMTNVTNVRGTINVYAPNSNNNYFNRVTTDPIEPDKFRLNVGSIGTGNYTVYFHARLKNS